MHSLHLIFACCMSAMLAFLIGSQYGSYYSKNASFIFANDPCSSKTTSQNVCHKILQRYEFCRSKKDQRLECYGSKYKNISHHLFQTQKLLATVLAHSQSSADTRMLIDLTKKLEETSSIVQALVTCDTYMREESNSSHSIQKPVNVSEIGLDVCPEKYLGVMDGYPFYEKGYQLLNCSNQKSIAQLLTTVIDFWDTDKTTAKNVLLKINKIYPGIMMTVFHRYSESIKFGNVKEFNEALRPESFYTAIEKIQTKYTFFAQNLYHISSDARLERLIRLLDSGIADIAAGSHRNQSGHWKHGCYQTRMLNYDLKIEEGYYMSINSCIYCDYCSGPFIAKTEFLQKHPIRGILKKELMFLDYFHRISDVGRKIVNCPDSMFYTKSLSRLQYLTAKKWRPFVKKWDLNSIHLPEQVIKFSCEDLNATCGKAKGLNQKGMTNMPCCNQVLSNMILFFLKTAKKHGIETELSEGTNLGAVKFYGILPWEMDADIHYLSSHRNREKLISLIHLFKQQGHQLKEMKKIDNCMNTTDLGCGYFALTGYGWLVELYGMKQLGRHRLNNTGLGQTKILLDGHWVNTVPNPANVARNRYQDDIFKHAEHWKRQGRKSSFMTYRAGSFMKCQKPGHHACLDQFLAMGNLQFKTT